jgi:hypothetical protein
MSTSDKRRIRLVTVTVLLVLAVFLGILAVAVAGGFWLIVLSVLCLLGVIAVDRTMRMRPAAAPDDGEAAPESTTRAAGADSDDKVLLAVALVAILALFLFAVVRLATTTGSGPFAQPPKAVAPSTTTRPAPQEHQQQQQQQRDYVTAGTDVHLRAAATTASSIVTTMPAFATSLTLTCYQEGEVVFSDPYWYRASYDGLRGYVSELWLDTGADPARTDLPHC